MWRRRRRLGGFTDSGQRFLNSLLLELEMCLFFKLSRLLVPPICPGMTARWYYKTGRREREGGMRGQNGERERLLGNLSANICAR